VKTFILECI